MASSRVSSAGSARARQPAGDVGSRLVGCREPELCGCVCVCDVTCTVCVCDVTLLCGVLPWRCVCTRARACRLLAACACAGRDAIATPGRSREGYPAHRRRHDGPRRRTRLPSVYWRLCVSARTVDSCATSLRPRPGRVRAPSGRRCRNQVCCFASRHEGGGKESRTLRVLIYERNRNRIKVATISMGTSRLTRAVAWSRRGRVVSVVGCGACLRL